MAGYLDYDIVAHNTAQKPVNFVFISGHFRFHGSKPFQVVGCVCFFLLPDVPLLYVNVCVGYCVPPDVTQYLPAMASQLRYFLRFKAVLIMTAETITE